MSTGRASVNWWIRSARSGVRGGCAGHAEDGKVALIAGVTKDLTSKVHAGKLIQALPSW